MPAEKGDINIESEEEEEEKKPMMTAMIAQENHLLGLSSLAYPIVRKNVHMYVGTVSLGGEKVIWPCQIQKSVMNVKHTHQNDIGGLVRR